MYGGGGGGRSTLPFMVVLFLTYMYFQVAMEVEEDVAEVAGVVEVDTVAVEVVDTEVEVAEATAATEAAAIGGSAPQCAPSYPFLAQRYICPVFGTPPSPALRLPLPIPTS